MKPLDTSEMQNSGFTEPMASDFITTSHWTSVPEEYLNDSNLMWTMFEKGHPIYGGEKTRFQPGQVPWLKGRKHTVESRLKMSLSRIGKPSLWKGKHGRSQESIEKMSIAKIGKNASELTRAKLRSARLSKIFPAKDTLPEKLMQEALIGRGLNFKTHVPLIGQPDIFIEPNLCVFVDGDYWHANPSKFIPEAILANKHNLTAKQIWDKDAKVTAELENKGYTVLRFWEHDIKNNLNQCIITILNKLN